MLTQREFEQVVVAIRCMHTYQFGDSPDAAYINRHNVGVLLERWVEPSETEVKADEPESALGQKK